LLVAAAACSKKQQAPTVQTAMVTRRDIIVQATGNGTIEPITIIDVKSKASGVITQMPVETGTDVKPGDLLVQVDTRDVQNKYNQAKAALDAAQAKLQVAESNKKRNEDMFKARVITPQEFEQVEVDYANANSGVVNAKANLDLAKQALEDATVTAPSEGTVIAKNVAVGTVIASATGTVSGGTTLVQMADLSVVRIRAQFNETDIGNVHPGEQATVTIDAYPDRRFQGVVAKIEPQAIIQQNVTMFPVLVNLENAEKLLKPGMNGEVSVLIDEHDNVLAVPNDAIKNPREAGATGAMLGMNQDTLMAELRAQGFNAGRGGRGGAGRRAGGRQGGNGAPGANGAAPTSGAATSGSAAGDIALQQGQSPNAQEPGRFQQPQVSDADCKKIDDVLAKHPKEKKQLDSLRNKMMSMRGAGGASRRDRSAGGAPSAGGSTGGAYGGGAAGGGAGGGGFRGSPEMQAINNQIRAIYTALNIDARTAGACRRQQAGNAGQMGSNGARGSRQMAGADQGGALTPSPEMGGAQRAKAGLVFVTDSTKTVFHPRIVQLGEGNLDFTEVISGLKEGERVVMLSALALQSQRQQMQDRFRQNASPLGGATGGRGGRGR
jgi:HlyD family secretion protein